MEHSLNITHPAVLTQARVGPDWKRVAAFVGLTYAVSWAIDFLLIATFGYEQVQAAIFLQLKMMIPAASAIILLRYVYPTSPIYFRIYREIPRYVFNLVLIYTLLLAVLAALTLAVPDAYPVAISLSVLFLSVFITLAIVVIRRRSRQPAFARVGLAGGKVRAWFLGGSAVVAYYALQTGLDYVFQLGSVPDITPLLPDPAVAPVAVLVSSFIQTVIVMSLLVGVILGFGEEFGWRGFLQAELFKMGRVKGALLLGLIWGLWHAPNILSGYNYPGHPWLGILVFIVYTVLIGVVLSYVVLKTGSIWLAAFLHAVNNHTYQFTSQLVYRPNDPVFSFGIGLYGIVILFVIVLVLLRDPVWRPANLSQNQA